MKNETKMTDGVLETVVNSLIIDTFRNRIQALREAIDEHWKLLVIELEDEMFPCEQFANFIEKFNELTAAYRSSSNWNHLHPANEATYVHRIVDEDYARTKTVDVIIPLAEKDPFNVYRYVDGNIDGQLSIMIENAWFAKERPIVKMKSPVTVLTNTSPPEKDSKKSCSTNPNAVDNEFRLASDNIPLPAACETIRRFSQMGKDINRDILQLKSTLYTALRKADTYDDAISIVPDAAKYLNTDVDLGVNKMLEEMRKIS